MDAGTTPGGILSRDTTRDVIPFFSHPQPTKNQLVHDVSDDALECLFVCVVVQGILPSIRGGQGAMCLDGDCIARQR